MLGYMQHKGVQMKEKRLTLNSDKRKSIADVFQSHWEREDNPKVEAWNKAIETYNTVRPIMKEYVEDIVRQHQPQEDIDTVRRMNNKYGNSGGELFEDNCFYFQHPIIKVDDNGKEYESDNEIHLKFGLSDLDKRFGYSYYRKELKAKGLDPDFNLRIENDYSKRNPKYYTTETDVNSFLGYRNSSNEDKSVIKPTAEWDSDFKLWVIGTSYCHSRQFKVNEEQYKILATYNNAVEKVIQCHSDLFSYVENKMKKLRLGLKSYRYFDQAKSLADKLGVALNESILNESSSMALSIYSPENLASLLEDKVEMTREQKIALFRNNQQQSVN